MKTCPICNREPKYKTSWWCEDCTIAYDNSDGHIAEWAANRAREFEREKAKVLMDEIERLKKLVGEVDGYIESAMFKLEEDINEAKLEEDDPAIPSESLKKVFQKVLKAFSKELEDRKILTGVFLKDDGAVAFVMQGDSYRAEIECREVGEVSTEPPPQDSKIVRRTDTEESRAYWEFIDNNSAIVASWPEWKKGWR
jgi:hypothetical protein